MHDDRVERDFTAESINELWLTDITEHWTAWIPGRRGRALPVRDQRRLLGPDRRVQHRRAHAVRLAVAALNDAVARGGHRVAGCIVNFDRGSQFRSAVSVSVSNRHGLVGSTGRVGAAGDNAAMETFFALPQRSVLDRQCWATREQLRGAIVTWIERTYHRRRRQARLVRLTPIEYETIINTAGSAA